MAAPTYQPPRHISIRSYLLRFSAVLVTLWLILIGPSCFRARQAGSDWPEFLPTTRFWFLQRLTGAKGKPITQVLQEMKGYTVWTGILSVTPPPGTPTHRFAADFTGTLSFANDRDAGFMPGYYCVHFDKGIATGVSIFDD
jgi:hypothetical protein